MCSVGGVVLVFHLAGALVTIVTDIQQWHISANMRFVHDPEYSKLQNKLLCSALAMLCSVLCLFSYRQFFFWPVLVLKVYSERALYAYTWPYVVRPT